jgi:ribosomal protein S18 acetylase RimI-like enzyme
MASDPPLDFPVVLRPAEPHEAAAIAGIVRAAYARWVPAIGREPLPMRVDYEKALQEHRFDVIADGDRIVGVIETMQRDDHIWIENVAVAPEAQGCGIGRRLLDHAERLALAANCFEARLLTNAAFEANVALYRRLGYVVDREEPYLNGITVYMSKKLAR